MANQFERTALILGEAALERLSRARVAVFGLGGVGGYVVEGLVRAGVGNLVIVDNDVITKSNLNRQILALHSTLGQAKTEVAQKRIQDINPACRVEAHKTFVLPENADSFHFDTYDYVVDAVDTLTAKLCLAACAKRAGTPIISCMGTGNKTQAEFVITDIYQTHTDPLARVMRKELKKRGIDSLKVLYSPQKGTRPAAEALERVMRAEQAEGSVRRDVPGSISTVPSVAGLMIAGEVIKDLLANS